MEKQRTGVGRRKEAVTRIFLTKGDGKITVNDKGLQSLFSAGVFAEPGGTSLKDNRCV
jgi:ribosomal protein S9